MAQANVRPRMATGVVIDLWRWPVLGMLGEQLISTRIDAHGVAGDRVHVVQGPLETLITGAQEPNPSIPS